VNHRPLPTLLTVLLVTGITGPLLAQTTASLRVRVLDGSRRPLAGVQVLLESVERADRRLLRTDGAGQATASGLLPGSYRLQGQVLRLKADERAEVTLTGESAQAVVVVEASPLRTESSSVAVQTSFEALNLERLPFSPHRYVEHSYLVPGVSPSGKPEPVVLGSMLDGNAFLVDGMPTNLASNGRFGINLGSEILESQTITTGGHKAEIGFASGGAFSMVTRSGTNRFQGALFGSRIARSLNARPGAGKANFPEERATDASEWGFSVGGPLVPDRLFFFAAMERQMLSLDFENVRPAGGAPETRSQVEDRQYRFAKLTWLLGSDHRLELACLSDPVLQGNFDSAGDSSLKDNQLPNRTRGGTSLLLKHVGVLGAELTWETTLGLHRTNFQWSPATPEAGPARTELDAPGNESFGRYPEERLDRIRNLSLRSELTLAMGNHLVKTGFQGLRAEYTQAYKRPSGGLLFLDRAAGGSGPTADELTAIRAGLGALQGSSFNYVAADTLATPSPVSGLLAGNRASYLYQRTLSDLGAYGNPLVQRIGGLFGQDDWKLAPGWILNLGLRVDRASIAGEDGRSLYAQTLLSPRLGASWDPADDGRTRFFAYWGRIYSPPAPGNLTAAGATTGGPALRLQVWIPSLQDWRTFQQTGVQGVKNVAIGELRAPRTDLAQVGAERLQALPGLGTWILEAVLTQKRVWDLIDTYLPGYGYLPSLTAEANTSAGKKLIANLPDLRRDFLGFDLSAHRSFEGGHRAQLSYSYGDLRGNSEVGNVASATGKNTGFAQIPSLREDYRLPQYSGPLNESVKHAWKAFGTASLPLGLEASFAFVLRSGLRYSPLGVVSKDNVLAPGASRGERELPRVSALDLSLAWTRTLGACRYRASLDVFNLLNAQPMTVINNLVGAFTPGNVQQPRVLQGSLRVSF
jgi:hypothetical protein